MRIVILHGFVETVEDVLRRLADINPELVDRVLPTRDARDVRLEVERAESEGEVVFVVVTGNGLTTRAYNTMIQLKNRYPERVLFLAYTSLGTADRLHGIIPRGIKGEDHALVARVLAFVAEAEGKVTIEQVVEAFPDVTSNLQSVK